MPDEKVQSLFREYIVEEYHLKVQPFYIPVGDEVEIFTAAYEQRIPVLLKGPTGCGKTRFVEYMSYHLGEMKYKGKKGGDVGLPLVTIACHEDLTASDLVGRYLLEGQETKWIDGPLSRAVKVGAICYLDEVVEARKDTTVLIHPLTDHRRLLPVEKRGQILEAHENFLLVISYNPGYQNAMKDLKQSTRQRFVSLEFDYPPRDIESKVIQHEGGVDAAVAMDLAKLGEKVRHLKDHGLQEGASTRLLIYAAKLIAGGIAPRRACATAVIWALTDDVEVQRSVEEVVATIFPLAGSQEGTLTSNPFESELQQYPAAVLAEFKKAEAAVRLRLQPDDMTAWEQEGLAIAQHSFRSWEAASEYFKASASAAARLNPAGLARWGAWGRGLATDSPVISSAFFKATPPVLDRMTGEDFFRWAALGKTLYNGTWKSSSLCSTYYDASPSLLNALSLPEIEGLVALVDLLSQKSYDAANDCLLGADAIFARVDAGDRANFLALAVTLTRENWRDLKAYFEHTPRVLLHLERSQRARFLNLGETIAKSQRTNLIMFLTDSASALGEVEPAGHAQLLALAERLAAVQPAAVGDFLKSVPSLHNRIKDDQLVRWFENGLEIIKENEEGGLAYFRMESTRAEQAVESLSYGIQLGSIQDLLQMYCHALAGETVDLQASAELKEKNIGWNSSEMPTTEGNHVFLPAFVERYQNKDENFGWYKVIATHQAAHLEFNSFHFGFDRPSTIFAALDLRPSRQPTTTESKAMSDLQRFFDLFVDRRLASDIFALVEDSRLDNIVRREYRGLRPMYQRVQQEAIGGRPDPKTLPLREALMELLVRMSLEDTAVVAVPIELEPHVEVLSQLVHSLRQMGATVEDSAEITLRVYDIVRDVPNIEVPPEAYQEQQLPQKDQASADDMEQLMKQLQNAGKQGDEKTFRSPRPVDFRGEFKPELVQTLANLKDQASQKDNGQDGVPDADDLRSMLERSVEMQNAADDSDSDQDATYLNNILDEAAKQKQKAGSGTQFPHMQDSEAALAANEPQTFLYDEWDFRAGDYKPRWCAIRERRMEDGNTDFFERTLQTNHILVSQIKRQFEMLQPQQLRKIKHLPDGEEYDFDAVVDALIEARAGESPSDKIYWRRNKIAREVACVFLLDMSASTAEAIDEGRRQLDSWDFPDDPKDYMTWLRSRRDEVNRRSYKRIIDIEKEGTVLLIKALEAIGDTYGIYGFSGYGRENVEFYVIKDLEETFSDQVKKRIDRITPMHATRMGPAIRHATAKLNKQDARTKILFLISDGRPQDRGYSREGVEKEYAVHDTRQALLEARQKGITPFCLTVDRAGHDYLKTMMSDMGYEILADIQSLPKRLPTLYRKLTV